MLLGCIGTFVYEIEFTGGPGVGKGTQCTRLAQDLGLVHISVGDLLRIEKEEGQPEVRELIETHMQGGTIVPTGITMAILKAAIIRHVEGDKRRFLVDGFPRHMEQALAFEKVICPCRAVLYFEGSREIMLQRLLNRAKTSGRVDDNEVTFNKRMKGFWEETLPVIEYFQSKGKLITVQAKEKLARFMS
ncbi:MAG: hypothetical protein M1839_008400 [Geoglossum umbratile]|nr:MAG: hypothetical protein M1839_008400 [Geoglossum umbratile]